MRENAEQKGGWLFECLCSVSVFSCLADQRFLLLTNHSNHEQSEFTDGQIRSIAPHGPLAVGILY